MRVASLTAIALVAASPANAWFWRDKSYEECMLSEMKGQDRSMYSVVDKVCSRRWSKEVEIWSSAVKWSFSSKNGVASIQIDDSGEYEITTMKVRFAPRPSQKECKELSERDWGELQHIAVSNNRGTAFARNAFQSEQTCMKTDSIRGKYK